MNATITNRSIIAIAELNAEFDSHAAAQNLPQAAAAFENSKGDAAHITAKRSVSAAQAKALELEGFFNSYIESLKGIAACMWDYRNAYIMQAQAQTQAAQAFGNNAVQSNAEKAKQAAQAAAEKAAELRSRSIIAGKAAELQEKAAQAAAKKAADAAAELEKGKAAAEKAEKAAQALAELAELAAKKAAEGKAAQEKAAAEKAAAAEQKRSAAAAKAAADAAQKAAEKAEKAKQKAAQAAQNIAELEKSKAAADAAAELEKGKATQAAQAAQAAQKTFAEYAKGMNAAAAALLQYNDCKAAAEKAVKHDKKVKSADSSAAAALAKTAKEKAAENAAQALAALPECITAAQQLAEFPAIVIDTELETALINAFKSMLFVIGFTKKQALTALFDADKTKKERKTQADAAAMLYTVFSPYFIELVNVGKAQKIAAPAIYSSGKNAGSLKNAARAALETQLVQLYQNCAQRCSFADAAAELEKGKAERRAIAEEKAAAQADAAAAQAAKLKIIAKFTAA